MNKSIDINKKILGLTKDSCGNLYLGGKHFCGYGVNSFSLFVRYIADDCPPDYEEQFKLLKKYNIPFVRVNFGGYWQSYYEKFDKDPASIIAKMHEIVTCAEKYEIGLICSLLWYDGAVSAHVGEKRSAMGNPNSKTVAYTKKYLSIIIPEFVDSPAIWGWELGNEYNLSADLCDKELKDYLPNGPATPKTPDGYDYYTSQELAVYAKLVGDEIRKYDKSRIISSGHGDIRDSSKALHLAAVKHDENHMWEMDWSQDSIEDFYEMCAYFTPEPLDTVCFHIQHTEQNSDGKVSYINEWPRFGRYNSTEEYIAAYIDAAKKADKVMYFGELGDLLWNENAEDAAEFFDGLIQTCVKAGVVLASTWQFMQNGLAATDKGIDGDKLRSLHKANQKFAAEGKQELASYWN